MLRDTLDPVDACQNVNCLPGDTGPCLPLWVEDVDGGTVGSYEHVCGDAWETLFDEHGWVIERSAADVQDAATRRAA